MRLLNEITLDVPPEQLFQRLLDIESVVPCIPGAELEKVEGDVYHANVKLKVGPIAVAYKGTVRFVDIDEADRVAVMRASGREARGQGKAEATITARVEGGEAGSKLTMETDLGIRGRVAQFGRNVMNEVSQSLMDQFADNLRNQLSAGASNGAKASVASEPEEAAPTPAAAEATGAEINPLVFLRPLAMRALPILGALLVGLALGSLVGRRRRQTGGAAIGMMPPSPPSSSSSFR